MRVSKKLEELNKSAYEYLVSVKDEFDSICHPLYELGITYFNYTYIFKSGTHIHLSNNLAFSKNFLTNILRVEGELLQDTFSSNRTFLKTGEVTKYSQKDKIIHLMFNFNIWHLLSIYERNHDSFIVYSFGLPRNFANPTEFYLNAVPLLEKYIEYFKVKASTIVDIKDTRTCAHFNQSFEFNGKSQDHLSQEKIQHFLQEIVRKRQIIKGKYEMVEITPRESECLHYLVLGYGVKGVASILELPPRTVESHLNKIKLKTGYYTKQELLVNYIDSQKLALSLKQAAFQTNNKFLIN